jgi:hypothetical protein
VTAVRAIVTRFSPESTCICALGPIPGAPARPRAGPCAARWRGPSRAAADALPRILLGRTRVESLRLSPDSVRQPPRRSHLMPGDDRMSSIAPNSVSRDAHV